MKTSAMFVGFMLIACSGWMTADRSTPGISITLVPGLPAYELTKVQEVRFTATIRNETPEIITIAHPSFCVPAEVKAREVHLFRDNRGKSDLLLEVTKPNGRRITLRDGGHAFFQDQDLGFDKSAFILTIPPGGTGSFYLGRFFASSLTTWEDLEDCATSFADKGIYKVRIILRNVLPKAMVLKNAAKKYEPVKVWMGEMRSKEATLEIR